MVIQLPQTIRTLRLTLRKPRTADARHVFEAYAQDLDVTRYLAWRPHRAIDETEAFMSSCMHEWDKGMRRPYVLARRGEEDVPIGLVEARILPHAIDVGYVLQRSSWGAGCMTEAIAALADAALTLSGCLRVQATCDTENHASARVLEKAGFLKEGRLERHAVLPNLGAEPRASFMYARCR